MNDQLDVVGLAPAGDLARLGEAAGDANVDAGIVDPLLLDQLAKFPFRGELFAGCDGHVDAGVARS